MVIQAVLTTTDEATADETDSAAQAVRQALEMTVAAVPFLDSVAVTIYDDDGKVIGGDDADADAG